MMKTKTVARAKRFSPRLEELETRLTPAGFQPTAVEQLFLEQLNDARAQSGSLWHVDWTRLVERGSSANRWPSTRC